MFLLEKYDATLKSSLEAILNISLSRDAWLQSSLPVNMGGLGIRYSLYMATPCFLASFCLISSPSSQPTFIIAEAQEFSETSGHAEEVPAGPVCCIQSVWEVPVIQHTLFDFTILTNTSEDKARLLAAQCMIFGSWINTLPSPQLGTHMSEETFTLSHLSGTSKTAGYAAATREVEKKKTYAQLLNHFEFIQVDTRNRKTYYFYNW
ncbi:hypothetical protein ILUMI_21561 [Ignelater luminosus]|uniref:Uncharacterized protein n=1 Tax=Ignelater luminosus TaxID=2038154 RepID=A0A8K0G3G1_IGNLU|nr:hypothetical protein ILUMI_21561 [Ignelater luminosus]